MLKAHAARLELQAADQSKAEATREVAGRIPMPGEVVVVGKTRLEVLASTDRRVERVRVSAVEAPAA